MEVLLFIAVLGLGFFLGSRNKEPAVYSGNIQRASYSKIQRKKETWKEEFLPNQEQEEIFREIESGNKNHFVTGKAGTGKSYLLQYLKHKSRKKLVIAAPTGVAAINVGGQTIHSLFELAPGFFARNDLETITVSSRTKFLLRNIDTLVIDEISMVRADLLDAVDYVLRESRQNDLPFGGVQVVLFGDPYQLPPVVDSELQRYFAHNFGGPYFFNAEVWKRMELNVKELNHVFRQNEAHFKKILNEFRSGEVSNQALEEINRRVGVPPSEEGVILLAPTNDVVSGVNMARLRKLSGQQYSYRADIEGQLEKNTFPAEEVLILKIGAQVMFVKNDKDKRWVNGTIGMVESLSGNEVKVNVGGIVYAVGKETWAKIRYSYDPDARQVEEEIVSSFTQYPLKLAWAVTIHKSQGGTYDRIVVDMGRGAFTHGQTYVALSRCRTLSGLFLKRPIQREDVIVDPLVLDFMREHSLS